MPNGFITHLLEVRDTLLPPIARLAVIHHPRTVLDYLSYEPNLPEQAEPYAMQHSIAIWQAAKSKKGDIPCGVGTDGGIQISK